MDNKFNKQDILQIVQLSYEENNVIMEMLKRDEIISMTCFHKLTFNDFDFGTTST